MLMYVTNGDLIYQHAEDFKISPAKYGRDLVLNNFKRKRLAYVVGSKCGMHGQQQQQGAVLSLNLSTFSLAPLSSPKQCITKSTYSNMHLDMYLKATQIYSTEILYILKKMMMLRMTRPSDMGIDRGTTIPMQLTVL
ncbi:hypothetical protein M514_03820 [Trichuris suis]|uniref:Uncharacterized protein n=1 Tax=Trichuris suis TaxID=68888 RepID=A0A085MD83_9BILA|nr:hypothetical protein M513_03820 [Trichuris suis]KFD65431.1 hypothetical protein M514_03820 [Trichuris suis]